MRCIKKGTILEQIFKGKCSVCGSEFEATRKELSVLCDDRPCSQEYAMEFCPECKTTSRKTVRLYQVREMREIDILEGNRG